MLDDLSPSHQKKIYNFDIQLKYEVDKSKWWKSLLMKNPSNMVKYHDKLTSLELELMEMVNDVDGEMRMTEMLDGTEWKNENGYLELCREIKKFYEERKEIVGASKITFKEEEDCPYGRLRPGLEEQIWRGDELPLFLPAMNPAQAMILVGKQRGEHKFKVCNKFVSGTGSKPREYKPRR